MLAIQSLQLCAESADNFSLNPTAERAPRLDLASVPAAGYFSR